MASDYDVGYKKPPKRSQFKKGKSGNPKGRKKGTKGFSTIVKEALTQPVPVTLGGVKQNLTPVELAFKALTANTAKGDIKSITSVITLAREFLPKTDEPEVITFTITEETRRSMEYFEQLARDADIDEPKSELVEQMLPSAPPTEDDLE